MTHTDSRRRLIATYLLLSAVTSAACVGRVFDRWTGVSLTRELQKTGEPAEAVVLKISDTGMSQNRNPVALLTLEVHRRDGEIYQATAKALIGRLDVPQFQPGARLPVRIDPHDKTRVALDVYKY